MWEDTIADLHMLSNELPTLSQIFRKLRHENYSSAFYSWESGWVSMSLGPVVSCNLKKTQTPVQITTLNRDLQKGRGIEQGGNWVTTTDLNRRSLACFPLIQETCVKFILTLMIGEPNIVTFWWLLLFQGDRV